MRIGSDGYGHFDLTKLTNMEIWSVTFFAFSEDGTKIDEETTLHDRNALASALFDMSIRGKSIDHMDYDRNSFHFAVVLVDDMQHGTNITPKMVEDILSLNLFPFYSEARNA